MSKVFVVVRTWYPSEDGDEKEVNVVGVFSDEKDAELFIDKQGEHCCIGYELFEFNVNSPSEGILKLYK